MITCVGGLPRIIALVALWVTLMSQAVAVSQEVSVSFEQMLPFTDLLNEVSNRRRLTVYQTNPQSVYDGAAVAFVNTSRGNVTFFRNDLIELGATPIVMRRVYDSGLSTSPDFGNAGWRLSIAETVSLLADGRYRYAEFSGAQVLLTRDAQTLAEVRPESRSWTTIKIDSPTALSVYYRNGLVKSFTLGEDGKTYRLRTATYPDGRQLQLMYDALDRLTKVSAGASGVELTRDETGRITNISAASGKQVQYVYTGGRLTSVLDVGGHAWRYGYDNENRLVSAHSPGADPDLLIDYRVDGLVSGIRHNSSLVRLHYLAESEEPDVVTETIVTRENGSIFRYGHDANGRTVFIMNATGNRTRLHFDAKGLIHQVIVNRSPVYKFTYNSAGMPQQVQEYRGDTRKTFRIDYDEHGRLRRISDDAGGVHVQVLSVVDGYRVDHHDMGLQLSVDGSGNLVRVLADDGTRADIDFDSSGNPLRVAINGGAPVRLQYTPHHRLRRIDYANGESRNYTYDRVGLRRSISGAAVDTAFAYSPAGNLIETHRSVPGSDPDDHTLYTLDDTERLVRIDQNGTQYLLAYNHHGDLEKLAVGNRYLRFDYDVLSRFYRVSSDVEQSWTYSYQPGETDVREVADRLTSRTLIGHGFYAEGFTRLDTITRNRVLLASHGVVHLDSRSGHVNLVPGFGLHIPGVVQYEGLVKARLLGAQRDSHRDSTGHINKKSFDAPSNILFLPPELAAVNCIFCPGLEPHGGPVSPAHADGTQQGQEENAPTPQTLFNIAHRLSAACDYGLPGGPNDPPACTLDIAGMPGYLCASRHATLGVSGSNDVNLNSVVWSSNGAINFLPHDFAHVGSSVQIVASEPGHAFVSADYLGQGNSCQDTVDAPILANKVTRYTDVIDEAVCPERQQDSDLSHDVDGCSIPAITGMLLGMHSPQDPVGGMPPNAATSTTFGQIDLPPIFSAADLSYPLPCNRHDVCYQTCGANRLDCDDQMLDNMEAVCFSAYPGCPFADPVDCLDWADDKEHCEDMSDLIYRGIRLFGSTAYKDRQVQYCDCCRP